MRTTVTYNYYTKEEREQREKLKNSKRVTAHMKSKNKYLTIKIRNETYADDILGLVRDQKKQYIITQKTLDKYKQYWTDDDYDRLCEMNEKNSCNYLTHYLTKKTPTSVEFEKYLYPFLKKYCSTFFTECRGKFREAITDDFNLDWWITHKKRITSLLCDYVKKTYNKLDIIQLHQIATIRTEEEIKKEKDMCEAVYVIHPEEIEEPKKKKKVVLYHL